MKLIYQNFDGLELSFQCAIPARILTQLAAAKTIAQQNGGKSYIEVGARNLPIMVSDKGAKGGYQYQFSTGHDGEIWLIADRGEYSWNVRVRVRSMCLAINGYEKTKDKILETLISDLRAKGPKENDFKPQERISRVDYCLDFLIDKEFRPDYRDFVCHGRTKKQEIGNLYYGQTSTGQLVETITLGKMPNRQTTIYNKIKEIKATSKTYWLKIWELNENEIEGNIWRVEIRAGKKELNKWNLRNFDDFEKIIGNLFLDILNNYKYTTPNKNDLNQSRWPMNKLWELCIISINADLFSYMETNKGAELLKDMRETIIKRYEKLISSLCVGLTAATGKDVSEIPGVLDHVCGHVLDEMELNPQKMIQKYKKKMDEFNQLG